jgi:hypothetical protein
VNKRSLFVMLLLAVFALATPALMAQSLVSGDITGTVTDPTGAVIANATVNLKSIEYGTTQAGTTNSSGFYRFSLLKPGHYSIQVAQAGFQKAERQAQVTVGQATAVNFTLSVGEATETIEVTSNAPLVNTDNANVSTSYSMQELSSVPNPGADISNIAQLAPGVTMNTSGGYGNLTANGLPGTANLFTINGENDMDPFFNIGNTGATNLMLGMNEVQEATVITNPYSGQYGQQAGAQVNVITKGGTNQFHGSAKYDWNGRAMNANDWFNNNSDTPRSFANNNQWGADFGGPIRKDKTFFYVNTEGLRYLMPTVQNTKIPTTFFENGVLSYLGDNQPNSLAMYQKLFNVQNSAVGAGNATPSASYSCGNLYTLDAATNTYVSQLPGYFPNMAPGVVPVCSQSFSSTPGALSTEWILSGRLDQNFGQNDKVFFRFKQDKGTQPTYTDPISHAFDAISHQPSYDGQMQWTKVFNGTTTNQFIMSGSYYRALFTNDEQAAVSEFPYDWNFGSVPFTNFARLRSFPQGRNVTQYQFIDDFSKNVGNHSLKFGANFRRYDVSDFNFFYLQPRVYVSDMLTFAEGEAQVRQDFTNQSAVPIAMYGLGMYAEDEWRVSNKLKVVLALRAEHNSNPVCQTDCFSRFTSDFNSLEHGADVAYNANILTGLHQAYPGTDAINLSPRLGFTWSPSGDDKTVVSGGIGIFYDALAQGIMEPAFTNLPGNLDFLTPTSLWADQTSAGGLAILSASNAAFTSNFANGGTYNSINAAMPAGVAFAAPSYTNFLGTMHTPQYQEWNLQIQRVLSRDMTLTVNYFGTHGIHVPTNSAWYNAYDDIGSGIGLPATAPDPSYGIVTQWQTAAVSNSNGLTTTLAKRFSHGFSFQANYTWSHSLDEVSNGGGFIYGNDSLESQLSPFSLRALNYGNSDYDIRHNFNANFVYETPKFSNMGLGHMLGGWTFAGTIFARTGLPFTVLDENNAFANGSSYAGYGFLPALPNSTAAQYGQGICNDPNDQCLSPDAFGDAYSGAQPTQRRNQYRGPGFFDVNMNVNKNINLSERFKLGIGANIYNLFNHANFANPDWGFGDSTFGQILSTVSTPASPYGSFVGAAASPRLIQLQAKITF